jgi:hypothetical protein
MNLSLQAIMIAATAALTLIVTMTGVIWWQSAKIDRAAESAAQVKVELSLCQANAASRLSQIERQNAAVVVQGVRDAVDKMNAQFQADAKRTGKPPIQIRATYQRTKLLDKTVETVAENLVVGATLVTVLLLVFLLMPLSRSAYKKEGRGLNLKPPLK